MTVEDAFAMGFDHVALCAGAGKPTVLDLPNGLARGVRAASDFLMALQLTGAAKRNSIANLQIRLPVVVIGGGLTAIDTATESLAYYPLQVEKFLVRHEALVQERGLAAVRAAGVGTKEDFYWTLHAVFVKRHEHSVLFDQAFHIFFRKRGYLERMMALMAPEMTGAQAQQEEPKASQRVLDALFSGGDKIERERQEMEGDASFTVSDREVLERKDFAEMTAAEIAAAKDAIKRMRLGFDDMKTRRLAPHPRGHQIDLRRTLRASMKGGGALIDLKYLGHKTKTPPIVALLDISGSMSQYTRLFLHFLHAETLGERRVDLHRFPRDAAALGFAGIYVGEEFGGSGLTRLDATIIFEELAAACASTAACSDAPRVDPISSGTTPRR